MRSEPVDYNHEECLSARIEWCQKFFELSDNMVEVVHVDKVGFIFFFTLQFGRARWDKDANEFVQLKGAEIYLWWVVVGCEGVIAQDVTFGAYNTYKFLWFIQTKVIPKPR